MELFSFWSLWIIVITVGLMIGLIVLVQATRNMNTGKEDSELMGHEFDGIEEYNNPLPKWWLWLFFGTIIFGFVYILQYPLGGWKGIWGWTSINQLEAEQAAHAEIYGEIFERYAEMPVEALLNEPQALAMGGQIFENNCAICHGKNAQGASDGLYGYPNLTDNDWLYGEVVDANGNVTRTLPEAIKLTLVYGIRAQDAPPEIGGYPQMAGYQEQYGEIAINQLAHYVASLSGETHDAQLASLGEGIYQNGVCAACHGKDGLGGLGIPNLTDNIWLYREADASLIENIRFTLRHGRAGVMPAWQDILGDEKIHLLTAYVYSLSQAQPPQ